MKTTKTFEIEIERHNVTPAQFLAYLRSMQKKHPEMGGYFDLNMFSREGWSFDYSNALPTERPCESERATDKPYQKQTYIRNFDGTTYNEIIEFDFDDEKTGHGYYYTVQIDVADEDREANTAENVAAIIRRRAEQADRQEVKAENAEQEANEAERRGYTAQWWIDSKRTEAATLRREAAETRAAIKAAQEAQEAAQEAPAAEAEQQPTETENAPQAATQAADNDSTTDNTPAIMEAIENAHRSRYSARQTAPLTFAIWDNVKNIPIIETTSNGITAYMDIFGIDHIDTDTAEPTDTDTEEKKEAETMTTAEREALERINARQNAANLFTNIGPADIAAEIETMNAEQKEEEHTMKLYRIEEGRKATHICIEAEIVNHTDWAALHILHTKAEALKTVEWYITDGDIIYTARGEYRYINREVVADGSICYHIPGKGWTCLSEGEPVKMSDLRKADAIQASNADDEMAWAADPERVTVYIMDEDTLRVDIDAGELADDCEAVNVAELEERADDELDIIRIQPTAQTAEQTAESCAHYTRHALRRFPELAEKVLAAIADPANDGRWTDADSISDIVWPICNAIENPAQQPQEAPAAEAEQQPTETENAPQAATQAPEQPTTDEQKEEDTPMSITPAERIQACNIIIRLGGYRERDLLTRPHEITRGETWNAEHKVVNVTETTPDPDGYRPGCAVDLVTRSIVG